MNESIAFSGTVAFAASWVLLRVLAGPADQIGLVDHPKGRKLHQNPTPLSGGIAIFFAFFLAVLTLHNTPFAPHRMFFAGATILVLVGVLDDLRELTPSQRFGAHVLAAVLMIASGDAVLEDLGHLLSPEWILSLGILAIPVTVFATVGLINAMNLSDGLDGLAASLVLITLTALGILAWLGDAFLTVAILLLLALALLPFLGLNLRRRGRALVFMGDGGSTFLGFVLAWFLIQASQGGDRLMAPVTALWIFAVPLIDTVAIMCRRLLLGRSPFQADREHFHHLLLAAGFNEKQALALIVVLAIAAACFGLAGELLGITERWMFVAFLSLFGLHFWIMMHAWRTKRLLRRTFAESRG